MTSGPLAVEVSELTDEALLDGLQRAAFGYFLEAVNPANGLVADTSRENSPSSIAVDGFALSAYPVAVERRWMARADALKRSLSVLRFFRDRGGPVCLDSPEGFLRCNPGGLFHGHAANFISSSPKYAASGVRS